MIAKRGAATVRRPTWFLMALAVSVGMMTSGCRSAPDASTPLKVILEKDNVYATVDGVDLMVDVARPDGVGGRWPVVIQMPASGGGGLWDAGGYRGDMEYAIRLGAKQGYVVVTADYRNISDGYEFPAQLADVVCLIRWLRANARKYSIDPRRIGIYGTAAEGHIALLAGLMSERDLAEVGADCGDTRYSSRVQAVLTSGAPADMLMAYESPIIGGQVARFMGGTPEEMPEQYRLASPVTYVSKDDPPVLAEYNLVDAWVPVAHGEALEARMKQEGVRSSLRINSSGRPRNYASLSAANPYEFFDEHLK